MRARRTVGLTGAALAGLMVAVSSIGAGAAETTLVVGGVAGVIQRLTGVNIGPLGNGDNPSLTTAYQERGITLVRSHDYYGPLDMATMYPDRTLDPAAQGSFNFTGPVGGDGRSSDETFRAIVEGGFEPYLRLGDSYNNVKVPTAAERANWIQAAVQVVRHYRDGQWNGFTSNLRYVEIWNEPDNLQFWPQPNSRADYYTLYTETAAALRAAFPTLRIGGAGVTPAGCQAPSGQVFVRGLLDRIAAARAPLDFFSWHMYSNNPDDISTCAAFYRTELDARGLQGTVQHVTEWNTDARSVPADEGVQLRAGARGAAITTASWINMQLAGIDQQMFYRGPEPADDGGAFFGMFRSSGEPKKMGHAAAFWYTMTGYGNRRAVTGAPSGLYALAGSNAAGGLAVLVANTSAAPRTWTYAYADGRALPSAFTVQTVSDEAEGIVASTGRTASFTVPAYGVQLVTAGSAASTASFAATASAGAAEGEVQLHVQTAAEDVGRRGQMYVMATVGGRWSFYTPEGWVRWPASGYAPYFAGLLAPARTLRVVLPEKFERYADSALYVGYGASPGDMRDSGRFQAVHLR